jgi:actin-related protein 10
MKTSGPEIQREEYDTLCAESIARGENWRMMVEEAEVEMAALVGVEVESLRPGMALGDVEGGRKRGWRDDRVLGDWSGFAGVKTS